MPGRFPPSRTDSGVSLAAVRAWMPPMRFRLTKVVPNRESSGPKAYLSAVLVLDDLDAVPVRRRYKDDAGKWQTFDLGTIHGPAKVEAVAGRLVDSDRGEFAAFDGFDLPQDVANAIASEASRVLGGGR